MQTRPYLCLLALAAAASWPAARGGEAPAAGGSLPDVRAIVKARRRAVVRVETYEGYATGVLRRTGRVLNPFPLGRTLRDATSLAFFVPTIIFPRARKRLGSGVVIDPKGILLTNHHVVRGTDHLTIRLTDARGVRRKFTAKVLGVDLQTDIAVLSIAPGKVALVVAPLGEAERLAIGDWVVAVGNPMNLTGTVTVGVVSGLHRQLGAVAVEDHIQIEAALNPGNSGGPLFNTRGEVVGICSLGVFGSNNLGFAVPTSLIAPYLAHFKAHGGPRRGYLGVTLKTITPEVADEHNLRVGDGVLVTKVAWLSPAATAGIRGGDVLASYAGRALKTARGAQMAVLRTLPGARVKVALRRGGKPLNVRATLGRRRVPFRF